MKTSRAEVFRAIDTERHYQDKLHTDTSQEDIPLTGELVLLRAYLRKAEDTYTSTFGDPSETPTLNMIRKIAGICVRCMENYGAPIRE